MDGRLVQQPGLADARLTHEEQESSAGTTSAVHELLDDRPLLRPAKQVRDRPPGAPRSPIGARTDKRVDVDPLLEDRLFEVAQLGAGVDPQVLDQHGARPLKGAQRVALTTRPIEGEHQQPPQTLPERVGRDRRLERCDHGFAATGGDLGLQLELDRGTPQFGEPAHLSLGKPLEEHVGEGFAAPQRQRRRSGLADGLDVARGTCRVGPFEMGLQLVDVHDDVLTGRVPGPRRAHRVAAEPLAELRDVVLEHPSGGGRRVVAPQVVDEAIAAYELAAVQQQVDQQRPLLRARRLDAPTIPRDLERAQDAGPNRRVRHARHGRRERD